MTLRPLVAAGVTPVLVAAPTGVVVWVLERQAALPGPGDRGYETAVVFAALAATAAALLALERWLPAVPAWSDGWTRQLGVDLAHGTISATLGTSAARVVLFGLVAAVSAGGAGIGVWPADWPLLAQLPLAIVVSDLGMYALHRASHAIPALWRIHAVHHSTERLYTVASGRVHPVYSALAVLCATGPILVLGAPPPLFALLSTFVGAAGLVQHSNVALDARPVRWLLATADAHRWHHAADPAEGGVNFGNTLSWWDRLFGTWRVPAGQPAAVGLGDPSYPQGWFGQLVAPFVRRG
ncbi:MAG: sterol desaturase family protein [Myxococcota bacterium]